MRILGKVERFDDTVISGWITCTDDAAKPALEVLYQDHLVGVSVAGGERADLAQAGLGGDGACEFKIVLPEGVGAHYRDLKLRIRGTDIYLTHPDLLPSTTAEMSALANFEGGRKVFVSGPARSGTSILYHALQSVFNLPGAGEGHVLPIYQDILFKFYEYTQEFRSNPGVLASHLEFQRFKSTIHADVRGVYSRLFPEGSFVDKTPGHRAIQSLRIARAVFPKCKLVILRRSGLEVVASYTRKFAAGFDEACIEWRDCERAVIELRKEIPDLLLVDHFVLRTRPYEIGQSLSSYLGSVDAGEALGVYFTENEVEKSASSRNVPSRLKDMNWTEEQAARFIELCEVEMIEGGYHL